MRKRSTRERAGRRPTGPVPYKSQGVRSLVQISTKGDGMRKVFLLACAGAFALAFSGTALATYTPKVIVSTTALAGVAGSTTIDFSQTVNDDPTAVITVFAPLGYTANLSQPAGATIGTVDAKAAAADIGGAILPLTGLVKTDDPAKYTDPATNKCAPATHAAVWLLVLTAAGQTLTVPAYVDPASGQETAFASYKIQTCLPPPDVPQNTPGRAAFGAKVLQAVFEVKGIFASPSAPNKYVWSSLLTPYMPNTGQANKAGTVESRSIAALPVGLTLTSQAGVKKGSVALAGSLTQGGQGVAGVKVRIWAGPKAKALRPAGFAASGAGGGFTLSQTPVLPTTFFQATAVIPVADATSTGCAPPSLAPGGCINATVGRVTLSSPVVKVSSPAGAAKPKTPKY